MAVAVLGIFWFVRTSRDPARLWNKAREAASVRDWKTTATALMRLAGLQTLTGEQGILLAESYQWLDRTDDALAALRAVPAGDPLAARARLLAGQVELRRRHLPAAEALLLEALEIDDSLIQARRELIYIYGVQLRRHELDAQFRAIAEVLTLNLDEVFLWSLSRSIRWGPTEAAADMRLFLKADPSDRWSRLALADNLFALNDLDEALKVLAVLPENDPEALARRAEIALAQDGRQAAAELLAKGSPDYPALAKIRGRLALLQRDGPEAVRQFRIARDDFPQDREALTGLSTALRLTGQTTEADKALAAARKLDRIAALLEKISSMDGREDLGLWVEIAQAYQAAGIDSKARAWLRLALSRKPDDLQVRQALLQLESPPDSEK